MSAPGFTVVGVTLRVEQGGRIREVEYAGGFDQVRTQDQARACGRTIGQALADDLVQRLQAGQDLRS